jgi:hypothetical protein
MATPKQIAANRRNAQHSTGPKTERGKANTRLNSLRHGLAAHTAVLPFESQAEYDAQEKALLEDLAPQGETEILLVKRFAQKQWLVQRLALTERGWLTTLYNAHYDEGLRGAKNPKSNPDPYQGLALCMLEVRPDDPQDLLHKNFFRYRSQIENEYHRALRALERARLLGPHRRPSPTTQTENPEIGSAPEPVAHPPSQPGTVPATTRTSPGFKTPGTVPNPSPMLSLIAPSTPTPAYDNEVLPCQNRTP